MTAWPASLPQSQFRGLTDKRQKAVLRTPMDAGPAIVRRRFTAVYREVVTRIVLNGTQRQTFDTFFITTLKEGSLPFDWTDPVDDTTVSFRFKEEPEWTMRRGGTTANRIWEATLSFEILP